MDGDQGSHGSTSLVGLPQEGKRTRGTDSGCWLCSDEDSIEEKEVDSKSGVSILFNLSPATVPCSGED